MRHTTFFALLLCFHKCDFLAAAQDCDILQMNSWNTETVIKVPNKKVEGWALPEMPGQQVLSFPFSVTQSIIRESVAWRYK